jgi:predicted dehydrogenase
VEELPVPTETVPEITVQTEPAETQSTVPVETTVAVSVEKTTIDAVPLHHQTDYPYIKFGNGTIATSGCSITCLSMIASWMTDQEYTPPQMAYHFGRFGKTNIERLDYGIAQMAYADGMIARFSSTTSYPASSWYTRLEVYGDKGGYLLTSGGPEGDHIYWWRDGAWTEESPYPVKKEWNAAADNFANALRTGEPLIVTAENGIRSRYVLDKLYESAKGEQGWIRL